VGTLGRYGFLGDTDVDELVALQTADCGWGVAEGGD
jgi:hypothetical protein